MVGDYIDYDEGYQSREEWQCPNRDCEEKFDEVPEVRTCEYGGCDVNTCPVCESVCFSCGRHLCAYHWMFADCGDGLRRYDQECIEDFVEMEQESREAA